MSALALSVNTAAELSAFLCLSERDSRLLAVLYLAPVAMLLMGSWDWFGSELLMTHCLLHSCRGCFQPFGGIKVLISALGHKLSCLRQLSAGIGT